LLQSASNVLTSMQPIYHFWTKFCLWCICRKSRVVVFLPLQLKQLLISLSLNLIHREYQPQLTIALLHFQHKFARFQPHLTSTSPSLNKNQLYSILITLILNLNFNQPQYHYHPSEPQLNSKSTSLIVNLKLT